jgi:hypothetical protein
VTTPDDLVDVAGELGVGDAEFSGTFLIDRLHRPASFEVDGDVGEMGHEGDAAHAFHALGLGRWIHPRLRVDGQTAMVNIRFI